MVHLGRSGLLNGFILRTPLSHNFHNNAVALALSCALDEPRQRYREAARRATLDAFAKQLRCDASRTTITNEQDDAKNERPYDHDGLGALDLWLNGCTMSAVYRCSPNQDTGEPDCQRR
jgi:hypothetical protein